MEEELTMEEIKLLDSAMSNIASAYYKETIPFVAKIKNHGIAREQIRKAHEQLGKILKKDELV